MRSRIGENGHLGLNEPGESLQPACHISQLDARTQQHEMLKPRVARDSWDHLRPEGYSQCPRSFVTGDWRRKAGCDRSFLTAKVSTAIPASFLWLHSNFICLINT
ncbi:Glucosamine-6-phosphate deaminase 1 [Escherichia coli]|nr:Glucosamine-6-phosphate deaminase 1 [Escherichia coli]